MILLATTTITTAVTAVTTTPFRGRHNVEYLTAQAIFAWGSGGTTAKFWVQTSLDGGVTWIDIMNFAFTTAIATKVSAVVTTTALAAGATPTDGTLADNTILSGLLGEEFRVKYTTTGTYAGGTTIQIAAVGKPYHV